MMVFYLPASDEQAEKLLKLASSLVPMLFRLPDAIGEDLQYGGWRWLFLILEKNMGTEKFRLLASSYIQEPERRKIGWMRAGFRRLLEKVSTLKENRDE